MWTCVSASLGIDAAAITLGELYKATMGDKRLWTGRSDIPHRCLVSCNVELFFGNLADTLLGLRTLDAERI
jgi:Rrf2 family transcriptional regulator, repressor of oqxAB